MSADNQAACFGHGGNVYAWAREHGREPAVVLDYSANINPLGLAPGVRAAISKAVGEVIHYPDAGAVMLKAAISSYYQVNAECITAGNGAVELLYVLTHTLRPQRVLIPAPAFSEYERAARAAGAGIEYAYLSPANNFTLDVAGLSRRLTSIDMVFIGNPNNPTGTLLTVGQLEQILFAAAQSGTIVVVDESFMDFIPGDREYTCRPLLKQYDNLVILHSLTKFYAIPGLRLGFALTQPALTARLHAAKDPWNVNSLAQAAGVAALSDQEYQGRSREIVHYEKDVLYTGLKAIPGTTPLPPAVNYILIRIQQTAARVCQAMAERNILIRDCSNYPGLSPYYIRVAVKLSEQNEKLLTQLEQVLR
ncbi:threonine-phosphate decarboxylase CobD [Sporomusa termitida]|uniref:threonine-phosphate decarboxylase n=1 Tax=Sporomusa termitida TaxID=2377 RepID=A0A517DSS7_9FIRM|nr:threonine-phosphate decarboxylase CobD [Sporomusa termitida]QDR80368.1 Threonine-phosphate decarboxylase [Sporomusa termitida]